METTTTMAKTTTAVTTTVSPAISCLQGKLDAVCQNTVKDTCTNFGYARYDITKARWRCYKSLNFDEERKSCVNNNGERILCESGKTDEGSGFYLCHIMYETNNSYD